MQIDKITDNSSEAIQDEIKRLANDVGLPQNTTLRLVNVAYCESKFKPSAIGYNENGTKDVGVFQINDIHNLSVEYRLDSKLNIKWAINEAKKNGLGAWQSSAHCWSK